MVKERMDMNTIRDLHSHVDSIRSNDTSCSSVFLYLPVSRCNDSLYLFTVLKLEYEQSRIMILSRHLD